MKHLAIPTVNILIQNDDKVLLSRRVNTGWMDGKLGVPGGYVEEGETPLQAIIREINEELGVEVSPTYLEFQCVVVRNLNPHQHIAFVFVLQGKNYNFINGEPEKCSELVWTDKNSLPEDIIPDFKEVLEQGLMRNKEYIEVGF